jgi:3-hydroxyacyl-[acyl-carrier-protein] dehydratase
MNNEILSRIPHRDPFLFVDEIIEETDTTLSAKRTVKEDEYYFKGHYPNNPVMPGVLLMETIFQCGALLLSKKVDKDAPGVPVITRVSDAKFKKMVVPGDTLDIFVEIKETVSGVYFMTGSIKKQGKLSVRCEFACTLASPNGIV